MEDMRVVRGRLSAEKGLLARQMRREMTPAERHLWNHLRANRLAGLHFRRQQVIDGFIADFYCHEARLVIEVDGEVHDNQKEYDVERDSIIATRGLRVIRFLNSRLEMDLIGGLDEILSAALRK